MQDGFTHVGLLNADENGKLGLILSGLVENDKADKAQTWIFQTSLEFYPFLAGAVTTFISDSGYLSFSRYINKHFFNTYT